MKQYEFELPCYMFVGSKKISLNLNWYRNAHYQELNKTKQTYSPCNVVLFKAKKINIEYTFVWNSNRRTDFMNWITIADKYFLDWLVKWNCLKDDCIDNYNAVSVSVIKDSSAKESFIRAKVMVIE